MDLSIFQKRINYLGDLQELAETIVETYDLGILFEFEPILQGYEDFNLRLETSEGKYLAKIMATFRNDEEAEQYAKIMQLAVEAGVSHPKIYLLNGQPLCRFELGGVNLRVVLMDCIEGQDFFQLQVKPTQEEQDFLVRQAAKINNLEFWPNPVYDSWAIPNFLIEYEKVKDQLDEEDLLFIEPLVKIFPTLHLEQLPQAFVHGDIIATNVMRAYSGELYLLDFAVANTYPRIVELAVLFCDLLFDSDKQKYLENYNRALEVYLETNPLEPEEIELLPTLVKLAHAMHIVAATREKIASNTLPENDFWLKSGKAGLRLANEIWK